MAEKNRRKAFVFDGGVAIITCDGPALLDVVAGLADDASCERLFIPVGGRFCSRAGREKERSYELLYAVCVSGSRFCIGLRAVGPTRDEMAVELDSFKKNNPHCPSVLRLTLDEFCTMEVEPAWFAERTIEKEV